MALMTKRQKQILDHIRDFVRDQGYAPSLTEIAQHFGLSSPATVHEHLKGLEEKGFIQRGWNRKRSVILLEPEARAPVTTDGVEIPLLGQIAAGQPIEAVLDDATVYVPPGMVREGRRNYALRVSGISMVDDHILDGDVVVIEAAENASDGQTVVALVEGANATLKRYYREGTTIRLQPANEHMEPIRVHERDLKIQGIVVGVIRTFGKGEFSASL